MSFLYIKGLDIKLDLISVERYNNAGVHTIKVKKDLWVSMKDVKSKKRSLGKYERC